MMPMFLSIQRSMTIVLQILLHIFLHPRETDCATLTGRESVVFPKLLESRSDNGTKVLRINEDLTLTLEKSSVLSKNFLLRTYEDRIMKHSYHDGEILEEDLYHDLRTFSSVMVSEENGLEVEGVIGPGLRIRPLRGGTRNVEGRTPHVLYENSDGLIQSGVNDGIGGATSLNISQRDDKRDESDTNVRVELLVAVDSTFRRQFRSVRTLLTYLTITLNSANVRYTTVSNPSVRLKLHAVEVLEEYTEHFLYRVDSYVAALRSLESFRDYVQQNPEKYGLYDAVYLITGLDMARYTGHGWDRELQGIAYVGGACTYRKVGMGEDKVGTFFGVRIFAHEVGHFSPQGTCLRRKDTKRRIKKANFTKGLPGEYLTRKGLCKSAFPEVQETYLMEGGEHSRCYGRCFIPERLYRVGFKTAIFPDNFPCSGNNGTICINGDCRKKKLRYASYRPS
ncbi:venom metalloproteinase 3-like isoform X2 [Dermacentor variabilis]|uniref:venom metalloproteinase 3-like isoform X2 n=1 Tax=Dermacentor variabilis TaxID=34621 RepID=UPI003F5C6BCC